MTYRAIAVTLDDIGGVVFEKDRSGGTVATMFNVTIAGRRQYSVKMDGRGVDTWQVLQVRRAPSELTLDASRLPTGGSVVPTSAQR